MAVAEPVNAWVAYRRENPTARLRLFCFPYAGGSASVFRTWNDRLPPQIEVCPIQLPGREGRLRESPCRHLPALLDQLAPVLRPFLDRPFAFFGHSLGALIAFEVATRLAGTPGPQPVELFVSGAPAPQMPESKPAIHALPDQEFVDALRGYGGTLEEVLRHEELMGILLPILRADFELLETHTYRAGPPLTMPIGIFGGLQDRQVTPDQLAGWRQQTIGRSAVHMLPGDHFFLNVSRDPLLAIITRELQPWLA